MEQRMYLEKVVPEAYNAMLAFSKYVASTPLKAFHTELIKIRSSQINGCAFCLNMHAQEARKKGETEQRIYMLGAWRETNLYTEEEQAILALTEEVTLVSQHVSDETYNRAAALLGEQYLVHVLMVIININAWNRIGVTTRMMVG